jgi:hypothetical protein
VQEQDILKLLALWTRSVDAHSRVLASLSKTFDRQQQDQECGVSHLAIALSICTVARLARITRNSQNADNMVHRAPRKSGKRTAKKIFLQPPSSEGAPSTGHRCSNGGESPRSRQSGPLHSGVDDLTCCHSWPSGPLHNGTEERASWEDRLFVEGTHVSTVKPLGSCLDVPISRSSSTTVGTIGLAHEGTDGGAYVSSHEEAHGQSCGSDSAGPGSCPQEAENVHGARDALHAVESGRVSQQGLGSGWLLEQSESCRRNVRIRLGRCRVVPQHAQPQRAFGSDLEDFVRGASERDIVERDSSEHCFGSQHATSRFPVSVPQSPSSGSGSAAPLRPCSQEGARDRRGNCMLVPNPRREVIGDHKFLALWEEVWPARTGNRVPAGPEMYRGLIRSTSDQSRNW